MIVRPNLYDGLRHFLFLLPGIALLAGYGAARIVSGLKTTVLQPVAAVLLFVLLALPLLSIVRLHPYQYCYYNASVGGLRGAHGKYETDYWVTSYKEAAHWINKTVKNRLLNDIPPRILVAANELSAGSIAYYLDKPIHITTIIQNGIKGAIPERYLFYISTTRFDLDNNFDQSRIVKKIGRNGAVFCVIKEM
jgi:hypothetical protein